MSQSKRDWVEGTLKALPSTSIIELGEPSPGMLTRSDSMCAAVLRSTEADRATLRFGLGRETPADRIDEIGAHVVEVVERLRAGSPAWRLRDETLDW